MQKLEKEKEENKITKTIINVLYCMSFSKNAIDSLHGDSSKRVRVMYRRLNSETVEVHIWTIFEAFMWEFSLT